MNKNNILINRKVNRQYRLKSHENSLVFQTSVTQKLYLLKNLMLCHENHHQSNLEEHNRVKY